jgi:hypothetical protein
VVSPLLAGAASYGGHRLNQYLGLTPGTPTLGPQTLDDYLALGLPMAPLAPMAARQALRYSRGGRALRAAETATQDAQAAYEAELAGQYAQRRAAVQQAERVAQEQTAAQQAAYEADLAGQYAQRRALLQTAEREAVETNAANRAAWEARGQEQYRQAAAAAQADSARKSGDLAAYNTAVQEQRDAVTRLQALPGQYLPKMPARNAVDVRQDMAMLDQGGQVAESVVKRLGAEDVFDAMGMLKQEADTFAQAGRTPRPGEAIAPSYRLPQARGGAQQGTELQTFLRQQGGLRLTNEELQGEFRALVTRKESGVSGLLNNRSGKSAQQLAEAAQEQGYIPTADKEALLEALRQSVTEGKPVYSRLAGEASFFGESPTPLPGQPRPTMSRNPGHQASSILYNRLEEVAGSAPVDLSLPMQTAMDFQAQLGVSMPAMQPSRLQKILTDLADMGDRGSVAQVHQAMKDLGPLTRSTDSKTKFMATQLRNALDDALEASSVEWPETAGARQLLQQAKGAWKQESAALDLEHLLRTGGPVIRSRGGTVTISPDALFNQVEAELAKPYSFLRQLPADQQAALRADIASFRGTPKIPTQPPMPPDAAPLPGAMSLRGMEPPTPVEPTYPRPVSVGPRPAPVEPAYPRPVSVGPAPPPVAPQVPWRGRRVLGEGVTIPLLVSAVTGPGLKAAMAGGAVLTAETLSYVLAKAMISPRVRPMVLAAMRAGGEISPELYGILGALAAEHTERGQP